MASQLVNELSCIKPCYEQNSIVNSVRADDLTAELSIIDSNGLDPNILVFQLMHGPQLSY